MAKRSALEHALAKIEEDIRVLENARAYLLRQQPTKPAPVRKKPAKPVEPRPLRVEAS